MATLSPLESALLAEEVYLIQNERTAKAFMARSEFASEAKSTKQLEASVGTLFWRAENSFEVFAKGSGRFQNDLFLVFRGTTDSKADWASNLNVGVQMSQTGLPVHSGFNKVFISMLPGIREFLAKHTTATGTVHCVGHSLGGAVANLAADWVKKHRGGQVKLYTFGAPRPGLAWFARSLGTRVHEDNIYRVYHKTDPVPMIPIFPFTHAPLSEFGYQIYSSESIVSREAHG